MILADTSIWVDHFRSFDDRLAHLIGNAQLFIHPLVIGELAMGSLKNRASVIEDLQLLPSASVATEDTVLELIERSALWGKGLTYIDACLLASAIFTEDCGLWTRDRRLADVARTLRVPDRLN